MDIQICPINDKEGLSEIFVPYFLDMLGQHAQLFPSLFRRFNSVAEFQKRFLEFSTSEDQERINQGLDIFLSFKNGDEVLGCAFVQDKVRQNEFAFADSRQLVVSCFVIDPKHRRQGLGKQCFNLLKNWAKEKGFSRIEISVAHKNEAAVALCQDMGFEKEMMYMSCQISDH
ncbi:MAG: GNAT family N-acetyltransferase [Spirochaetia bacterium]